MGGEIRYGRSTPARKTGGGKRERGAGRRKTQNIRRQRGDTRRRENRKDKKKEKGKRQQRESKKEDGRGRNKERHGKRERAPVGAWQREEEIAENGRASRMETRSARAMTEKCRGYRLNRESGRETRTDGERTGNN